MRVGSLPAGVICGVPVRLHSLFLLLLVGLAFTGHLVHALVMFSVVLAHELAHTWAAQSCGLPVSEIELLPFGGVARVDLPLEWDPSAELRVASVGPLSNLGLAGAAYCTAWSGWLPYEWVWPFVEMNFVLACFNLLPALPLDGGRIYRAILATRIGLKNATDRAVKLGRSLSVLIGSVGLYGTYTGRLNLSWVVLALFISMAARREQSQAPYSFVRYLSQKRGEISKRGSLRVEAIVVTAETSLKEVARQFVPQKYYIVLVADAKGELTGVATEPMLLEAMLSVGINTPVSRIAKPLL